MYEIILNLVQWFRSFPSVLSSNDHFVKAKKILNCFSGHFFKTDAAGLVFMFYSAKNRCGNSLFLKLRTNFLKQCFDSYFIRYNSSQAIKLDSESFAH